MSETNPLEPEVLELLDEIAADPSSTLLRIPREPLCRYLSLREGPVSAREPVLTKAEKHLVRAHREYVAKLLFDRCRLALTHGPIEENRIHRWVSEGQPLELPNEDRWRARAAGELESEFSDDALVQPRTLLDRCLRARSAPVASELAEASLRLVPCDETRIWLGLALHRERQSKSARHALHDVLAHRSSTLNQLWARVDCGFIAFAESDFGHAVEWYRSAAAVQEEAIPLLTWFASALQLGSKTEALQAAARLADHSGVERPVFSEFLAALQGIHPTRECVELISEIHESLSSATKGVADALLP